MATQEEGGDLRRGQSHHDTMQSGSPAGESSARESGKGLSKAIVTEKG